MKEPKVKKHHYSLVFSSLQSPLFILLHGYKLITTGRAVQLSYKASLQCVLHCSLSLIILLLDSLFWDIKETFWNFQEMETVVNCQSQLLHALILTTRFPVWVGRQKEVTELSEDKNVSCNLTSLFFWPSSIRIQK
jgi:hypothetical protein